MSTTPKGTRLMTENEVPQPGDFSKWSNSPRDPWVEIRPGNTFMIGLPITTIRDRVGQDQLQFRTHREANVRKNPPTGESQKVWITPDGAIHDIQAEKTWSTQLPMALLRKSFSLRDNYTDADLYRLGNRFGYYRGAVLNDRLYVHLDAGLGIEPRGLLLKYIKRSAARKGLTRGIVFERS